MDPHNGPTLSVVWQNPGFFGKEEIGQFVFRLNAVRIGLIPQKNVPLFAKETAAMNADRSNSATWIRVAGPLVGGLAALGGTLLAQMGAEQAESGVGVKGIGVYYSTGVAENNLGFFLAISHATVIDEIVKDFPEDKTFTYAER